MMGASINIFGNNRHQEDVHKSLGNLTGLTAEIKSCGHILGSYSSERDRLTWKQFQSTMQHLRNCIKQNKTSISFVYSIFF